MAETTTPAKNIMTGAKQNSYLKNIDNYSLFLGGANATHDVLESYDPLRTGYTRVFMVRKPVWVEKYDPQGMKTFKHILEYAFTAVNGFSDIQVDTSQMTGGYVQKSIDIPTSISDNSNQLSITVPEFSGSPVRSLLHTWINGSIDIMTSLAHYNGVDLPKLQANQTAEFIIVATDNTGMEVEYAALWANCFPKSINADPFNFTSGQHELVSTNIDFTGIKYESIQINQVARALIKKYRILGNSLNFHSGYDVTEKTSAPFDPTISGGSFNNDSGTLYDTTSGRLVPINNDNYKKNTDITRPDGDNASSPYYATGHILRDVTESH